MANIISGTADGDSLTGTAGDDEISGLDGSDVITVTRGHDTVDGGAGYDLLVANSFQLGLPAGPRSYLITANHLSDASGAIDTSFAGIEKLQLVDFEIGGSYDVTLDASAATVDLSIGLQAGTHHVTGGAGSDGISLNDGWGEADGGAGYDILGIGVDTTLYTGTLFVTRSHGATIVSQAGKGDLTTTNFERLSVTTALGGGSRVDASGAALDVNFGQTAYADLLIGGGGNDSLSVTYSNAISGAGDVLTGGAGADNFVFATFGALAGATITDFSALDRISLSAMIGPVQFIGAAAFSGSAGQVRYVAANGQTLLIADSDGDGLGDSTLTLANREMVLQESFGGSKVLQTTANVITGTDASQTINGTAGADQIAALNGNDTIRVSSGADLVDGGFGTDTLLLDASTLGLGAGPHSYTLTPQHLYDGSGAVDTIFYANVERVQIIDQTGSDVTLDASLLTGAALSVTVLGGTHDLLGSAGADSFSVGGGSGTLDGGGGIDSASFTTDNGVNANAVVVTQSGDATVLAQAGGPSLSMRNVETMLVGAKLGSALHVDASASSAGLTYVLTALADQVTGGAGNDIFTLSGTATGMDDVLTGGGGADSYNFTGLAAFNGMTIADLATEDTIRLTGLPAGAHFIGGQAFSGVAGEYRYLSGAGLTGLLADIDGDGAADSALLISNGAFVLAETTAGSGVLRIVGQMPPNDMDDNVVTGTDGVDYLDSGLGDDTVDGRGGNDVINTGEGDDEAAGGAGSDTIHGGAGNDTIDGGTDTDSIFGDEGDDVLTGTGGGADPGGLGGEWMLGGDGNDTLTGTAGLFRLFGEAGNDHLTLSGGTTGAWVDGGAGDDVIAASGSGTITATGADGDDDLTLTGFVGGTVSLGAGNDALRIVSGGGYTLNMAETFGGGQDRVVIQSLSAGLLVQGFSAGELGDVLDLSAYGADPFGTGALAFSRNGPDSIITIVATGVQIRLQGVDYQYLSAFNLGVANPYFAPGDQVINDSFADQPAVDWAGYLVGADGNDTIRGFGGNDQLFGAGGADALYGGIGNDQLHGGSGADSLHGDAGDDAMAGGTGDDSYDVDSAGDTVSEAAGEGYDTVVSAISYTLGDDLEALRAAEGASYLTFTGNALANRIYANSTGTNTLRGGGGEDELHGGAGRDVMRGDAGNDKLYGGLGDDTYVVDDAGDQIFEAEGEGRDQLILATSYVLAEGVSIELVATSEGPADVWPYPPPEPINFTGNSGNQNVAGNEAANVIDGGGGFDALDGRGGDDTLIGGDGTDYLKGGAGADLLMGGRDDDTYEDVDALDTIVELAGEGHDWIETRISYALPGQVEALRLMGTADIDGTGNELANSIYGNGGANHLAGGGGDDFLLGGDGNDLLDGGSGDDFLMGENGSDIASYSGAESGVTVDLAFGDQPQQTGGAGRDTLVGIEHLIGSAYADDLRGDGGANAIAGGGAQDWIQGAGGADELAGGDDSDSLWGGDGDDDLDGGAGDDTLWGGAGSDTVSYARAGAGVEVDLSWLEEQDTRGAGVDTLIGIENLTGSGLADRLIGNDGANVLRGGGGDDAIDGRGGDDLLFGDAGADLFAFGPGAGRDTIGDFLSGTDRIDLSAYGFASFAQLQAVMTDQGGATSIALGGGDVLVLTGVAPGALGAADFVLHL